MGNFLKNTLVGFVLGGLSLTLTNCSYEKIKADGSEFKYDNTLQKFAWEIKETKEDGTTIKYFRGSNNNKLNFIKIDGEEYYSWGLDTIIWKKAKERYNFAKKLHEEKHTPARKAREKRKLEKGLKAFD